MQPQYFAAPQNQNSGQQQVYYQEVPAQVMNQNVIMPVVNYVSQQMTPIQAFALLPPVPPQVSFTHEFLFTSSCCACNGICGTFEERSTFTINPLGQFVLENYINECCLCCKCTCFTCDCICN